jgi:DNA-nicking Smr family endonuclease
MDDWPSFLGRTLDALGLDSESLIPYITGIVSDEFMDDDEKEEALRDVVEADDLPSSLALPTLMEEHRSRPKHKIHRNDEQNRPDLVDSTAGVASVEELGLPDAETQGKETPSHQESADPTLLALVELDGKNTESDSESVGEELPPEISLLSSVFPRMPLPQLTWLLNEMDGDVMAALDNLLEVQKAALETLPPICRYYMDGGCFRSDCSYSHDPEQLPCPQWMEGSQCDSSCLYLHGYPLSAHPGFSAASQESQTSRVELEGEDSFPVLGTNFPSHAPTTSATWVQSSSSFLFSDRSSELLRLSLHYHWVRREELWECFRKFPSTTPGVITEELHSYVLATYPRPQGGEETEKTRQCQSQPQAIHSLRTAGAASWVEGGSSVRSMYETERKEAILLANARNKLFEQATQAYLRGDRATAKALSLRAKGLDVEMRQEQALAAESILAKRNSGDANILDLHGLHTSEAVEAVAGRVKSLSGGPFSHLDVITGTGHHTRTKHAHLRKAIQAWCTEHQMAVVIVGRDNQGGCLRIML